MLYIHELRHLTPKMADLESVYLIRELKQKTPYPLAIDRVHSLCSEFFISPTDIEALQAARQALPEAAQAVAALLRERNSLHEQVNLERALRILQELEQPLYYNQHYLEDMAAWQELCLENILPLLNELPKLRTKEQKLQHNEHLKKIFGRLLRNQEFLFKHQDIVHEGCVNSIGGLAEGMDKGFLVHITLEEELKKLSYEAIKQRLPAEEAERLEQLKERIIFVKKGIGRAFQANMRMINYAVILYSYVKWMASSL